VTHVGDVLYMAVVRATGDEAGELGIFRWNESAMEFILVQTTGTRDGNPVDASFFSLATSGETPRHFLVVANHESPANVYTYIPATSRFVWYHTLTFSLSDGRVLPPFDNILSAPPCPRGSISISPLPDLRNSLNASCPTEGNATGGGGGGRW